MSAYEGSAMQERNERFEEEQKRRADGDTWRCPTCRKWVVLGQRYPGRDNKQYCSRLCRGDDPKEISRCDGTKAKAYPQQPESRKRAREFVDDFKRATGYDFAQEFENELLIALEKMIDGIELKDPRGEPMVWRS